MKKKSSASTDSRIVMPAAGKPLQRALTMTAARKKRIGVSRVSRFRARLKRVAAINAAAEMRKRFVAEGLSSIFTAGHRSLERISIGCGARRFACAVTCASEPPCATWRTPCKSNPAATALTISVRRRGSIRRRFGHLRCADRKVSGVGVMKDERRDARFRLHHETFRKLHADLFRPKHAEQRGLLLKVRARRVAE